MSNHLLVVLLTWGFAAAQSFIVLMSAVLLLCFYVSFERSLRLVMSDEQ